MGQGSRALRPGRRCATTGSVTLLHGREQRLLHLPQEGIETFSTLATGGDVLRKGTGVAKVHEQIHLVCAQAEQMVTSNAGDLHC